MAKAWLAWSGGKDSALALYAARGGDVSGGAHDGLPCPRPEVTALLTTVTEGYDRISMHGVRRSLLLRQAEALGLPLVEVAIPPDCPNRVYEERMARALAAARAAGVQAVVFGDLFLEDIRRYREVQLSRLGLAAVFPLWGIGTRLLAQRFVMLGFKAWVVCVDTRQLDGSFAGRAYDEAFLADLPPGVDPCGENGEFHTFVYDGPLFAQPVRCRPGEAVLRDGRFAFCELLDGGGP